MLNTLFNRCAQVMADCRSVGVLSCPIAFRPPLPRLAGVTRIRCLLFGAKRESQSLGEISGIQITKRTKNQLLNDLKNAGKGILPDAKAAPSTVRKIDRNKRRK